MDDRYVVYCCSVPLSLHSPFYFHSPLLFHFPPAHNRSFQDTNCRSGSKARTKLAVPPLAHMMAVVCMPMGSDTSHPLTSQRIVVCTPRDRECHGVMSVGSVESVRLQVTKAGQPPPCRKPRWQQSTLNAVQKYDAISAALGSAAVNITRPIQ